MSRPRRLLVRTLIVLVIGGHALAFGLNLELWPFSPYGMYSGARSEYTLERYDLFGLDTGGNDFILTKQEYFAPLDHYRLRRGLANLAHDAEPAAEAELVSVLNHLLERYEQLRMTSRHDGPELVALRLYDVFWTLEPDASNVKIPTTRTLISETAQ